MLTLAARASTLYRCSARAPSKASGRPPLSPLSSCLRAVQIISRDIHRLANSFDFFRLLSFYYGGSGFYINTYMTVMFVYVYLYCRLILVLPPVADLLSTGSIAIRFELLQVRACVWHSTLRQATLATGCVATTAI